MIISGSTDYRTYQAAALRQRYAVRFISASGPVRKSSAARTPAESGITIAPKRLNDEVAELLRFKTSTFAAFGMQRNGVWGTETASQKVEHFGLWFGALVAPPESEVQASYAIQDTPDMVAQHYGRFLPQDKSEIAARILNQVWEAA